MKDEFNILPLGDVVEIVGGGTPSKRNPKFYGGNIPWATVRDMNVDELIKTEHSITAAGLAASSAKIIPAGNIVIVTRVGLGKVCLLKRDTAINQDLRGLLPKGNHPLEQKYLFYWYKSISEKVVAAGTGATVQGVKLPFVKSLPLPLPSPEEQRRIVAVLDEAFEGLDRARAHGEANMRDTKELFANNLAVVFQKIASDARRLGLSEAAVDFGRGRSRHRPRNDPDLYGGDYPFIQTGDIRNSNGIISNFFQTYNDWGLAQSKLWPRGTVCITIAANIAETGILGFDSCFPDSVIGMVCDQHETLPEYVEFMLRYFATDLKAQGKGSAQDNINLGTFEKSLFPFPTIERQRQVVKQLQRLSDEIDVLGQEFKVELADLDDLRKSILQRAFAGELT